MSNVHSVQVFSSSDVRREPWIPREAYDAIDAAFKNGTPAVQVSMWREEPGLPFAPRDIVELRFQVVR